MTRVMPDPVRLTLTNRRLLELDKGLSSLDAIRSGRDEVVHFEFSDETKYLIVHAAVVVRRAREAYDAFSRMKSEELGIFDGMESTPANAAKVQQFNAAIEAAKEKEVVLEGIEPIKGSALLTRPGDAKKGKNPIPPSVLTNLWPILDWGTA